MRIFYLKCTLIALALLVFPGITSHVCAQTTEKAEAEKEEKEQGYKITVAMGHAHIHEGIAEGDKKWLVMASWAMNVDYVLNSHWAVGLHNDLILEDFAVEEHLNNEENTVLERSTPIATKVVGTYKPGKHLGFMLGAGEEFAKEENLFLSTAGLDYGWHLKGGWEVGAELAYDVKWKSYDTWILGFGVSKFIDGHRRHKHI